MAELEELEPDYDTDEDAAKMADAHVMMQRDSFTDRRTTSRDPLINQESISMGTLDHSRHSRPSSTERVYSCI